MKNPQKTGFLISGNVLFALLFLGFVLFTSPDPVILHKFSRSYFTGLVILLLLILPYELLLLFLVNDETRVSVNDKTLRIGLVFRIFLALAVVVIFLLLTELFLRMRPKPLVENFHPFLQSINTKTNDSAFHVNSDGFRYDEIQKKKPKDTYRIFVMGGSTVFDEWHGYDQSLVKQVENLLRKKYPKRKIEVINAGYNRYTSEHSLILYETKVSDYQPDLVIIWQGFNDMYMSCTPDYQSNGPYKSDYSHFYGVLANVVNSYFNYSPRSYVFEIVKKSFREKFFAETICSTAIAVYD